MSRPDLSFYLTQAVVQAGRIEMIRQLDDEVNFMMQVRGRQGLFRQDVEARRFEHGVPVKGDYMVRYFDGSISWVPAAVLENEFHLLDHEGNPEFGRPIETPWEQVAVLYKTAWQGAESEVVCKITVPPYSTWPGLLQHEGKQYVQPFTPPADLAGMGEDVLFYHQVGCHFVHPDEVVQEEGQADG